MRDTKVKAKVKHMCSIRGVLRKDERKGTTSVIPTRGLTEVGHNEFHMRDTTLDMVKEFHTRCA